MEEARRLGYEDVARTINPGQSFRVNIMRLHREFEDAIARLRPDDVEAFRVGFEQGMRENRTLVSLAESRHVKPEELKVSFCRKIAEETDLAPKSPFPFLKEGTMPMAMASRKKLIPGQMEDIIEFSGHMKEIERIGDDDRAAVNELLAMAGNYRSRKELCANLQRVLGAIPYRSDMENYGVAEHYAGPAEFLENGGDCEDLASAAYHVLKKAGVPEEDLYIIELVPKSVSQAEQLEHLRTKDIDEWHTALAVADGKDVLVLESGRAVPGTWQESIIHKGWEVDKAWNGASGVIVTSSADMLGRMGLMEAKGPYEQGRGEETLLRLREGVPFSRIPETSKSFLDICLRAASTLYPLDLVRYLRNEKPAMLTPSFVRALGVHAAIYGRAENAEQFDIAAIRSEIPEALRKHFDEGLLSVPHSPAEKNKRLIQIPLPPDSDETRRRNREIEREIRNERSRKTLEDLKKGIPLSRQHLPSSSRGCLEAACRMFPQDTADYLRMSNPKAFELLIGEGVLKDPREKEQGKHLFVDPAPAKECGQGMCPLPGR